MAEVKVTGRPYLLSKEVEIEGSSYLVQDNNLTDGGVFCPLTVGLVAGLGLRAGDCGADAARGRAGAAAGAGVDGGAGVAVGLLAHASRIATIGP